MKAAKARDPRLGALRRFAVAITAFNVLGHAWFGFEQSIAQPLVALATGYCLSLLLEFLDAKWHGRAPRFTGSGAMGVINFLLSPHIASLAVSMLIYPNDRLLPVIFATATAICSKHIFTITINGRSRHIFNPSNIGISATLALFPWVAISPPYMFSENLSGIGDWILPAFIVASGSYLNAAFTKKIPLILSWAGAFALQGVVRHFAFGHALGSALLPMTGVAFVLFTFYMITDPATSPSKPRGQAIFGACVAAVYGLLVSMHVVFGIFFALTIVCAVRGVGLYVHSLVEGRVWTKSPLPASETVGRTGA